MKGGKTQNTSLSSQCWWGDRDSCALSLTSESLVFMAKCERLNAAPSFPVNKQNVSKLFCTCGEVWNKAQASGILKLLPNSSLFWNKKHAPHLAVSMNVRLHSWKVLSYCSGEFLTEIKAKSYQSSLPLWPTELVKPRCGIELPTPGHPWGSSPVPPPFHPQVSRSRPLFWMGAATHQCTLGW